MTVTGIWAGLDVLTLELTCCAAQDAAATLAIIGNAFNLVVSCEDSNQWPQHGKGHGSISRTSSGRLMPSILWPDAMLLLCAVRHPVHCLRRTGYFWFCCWHLHCISGPHHRWAGATDAWTAQWVTWLLRLVGCVLYSIWLQSGALDSHCSPVPGLNLCRPPWLLLVGRGFWPDPSQFREWRACIMQTTVCSAPEHLQHSERGISTGLLLLLSYLLAHGMPADPA